MSAGKIIAVQGQAIAQENWGVRELKRQTLL